MKPIRLYIDQPVTEGMELQLNKKASHYVSNVMRLKEDMVIHAFDGEGGYYICRILSAGGRSVTILPEEHVVEERESCLDITLVQGLARGQKMDYTIQKAVELGVNRIVPVVTEFSQVKLKPERADNRLSHWRGIVTNACEQCGRNRLAVVEQPLPLTEGIESDQEQTKWLLHPVSSQSLVDREPPAKARVTLLAGPEGGLSDRDREIAEKAGFEAVSLGPRILRTETAAVAALAACQTLWGDFRRT